MSEIAERLQKIIENIGFACESAKRDRSEVALLPITKNVTLDKVLEAYQCGYRSFGENRVQEAKQKSIQLPDDICWQMVGHLQTNKVKEAVHLFKVIQSVDSVKLAEKINAEAKNQGKVIEILIEINIGNEITKSGFKVQEYDEAMIRLRRLESLTIKGLMAVAPFYENVEIVRPFFRKMKELFDCSGDFEILSMGMSHDYIQAIQEGSTMIRLGEAIFGSRT